MTRPEAVKAVEAIVSDLTNRSGLGNEWEAIDPDIQTEIEEKWATLILQAAGGTP